MRMHRIDSRCVFGSRLTPPISQQFIDQIRSLQFRTNKIFHLISSDQDYALRCIQHHQRRTGMYIQPLSELRRDHHTPAVSH